MLHRLRLLIERDLWKIKVEELSPFKRFWYYTLRIFVLTAQGFTKSQIQTGASALTYYSLLAIVPMLALLVGIARGFLLEEALKNWLSERFVEQKEIIGQLINFAESSLKEAKGGLIVIIGAYILIWSGIKILRNIENVFNKIWEVKGGRSLARQFSDYLAMLLICPIFIIFTSGLTVYLSALVSDWGGSKFFYQPLGPILFFLLNLFPYFLTWVLFTFIYIFIPNTRVRFTSALYAGIITGTIYQVLQWAYVYFQINVSTYNAIYGTFAAIPLFLIWLHLSWVILLLGGKVAFAFQNVHAYQFVTEEFPLSHQFKILLCLRIAHSYIRRFCEAKSPLSAIELSNHLSIPHFLTLKLLNELVDSGILAEVRTERGKDSAFQPALDVNQLTIKRIIDMIDARGEKLELPSSPELNSLLKSLKEFSELIERSDANVPLKDI